MSAIASKPLLPNSLNNQFDKISNRYAQDSNTTLQSIAACPLIDGVLIQNIVVGATTTLIQHKLGRKWQGWMITDTVSATPVRRDSTSTANRASYLALIAASPVTVSLWVF